MHRGAGTGTSHLAYELRSVAHVVVIVIVGVVVVAVCVCVNLMDL